MKNRFFRLSALLLALFFLLPPTATAAETSLIGGPDSPILNFLLIGRDTQEGRSARSDTIILCTFHKEQKTLTLTSFLRDLYVSIPGYGKNRINAAYAFGGPELLKKTLKENFSLHIDGCTEVDFSQFAGIVDLLGGVTLTLREDEAAHISRETGTTLSGGLQTLSGTQALSYARIRKLDKEGDFGRTHRQRKVLSAMAAQVRQASLPTLLSLVRQLLPMVSTDLSTPQVLSNAMELFPIFSGGTITSQHIPTPDSCRYETIRGMSVLTADMSALKQHLKTTLLPG